MFFMSIANISVKRPVTTSMVFLLIVLLGILSWQKLPQELFPPLVFPQVTILTSYPNAAPEEIETLITKPIEEIVGTVKNLKRISSKSKEGISLVTAEFLWNTNMDMAAMNVREKIDLIKEKLPLEADEPVVMKYNPFELPIMIVSITGRKNLTPSELLYTTRHIIKDRLEKVDGVASIGISGGQERQILVEIDQNRLQANQISIIDVVEAIKNTNLNYPAGTTKERVFEYLVRTIGEYTSVKDIHSTVVEVDIDDEQRRQKEQYANPSDRRRKPTYKRSMVILSSIAQIKDTVKERTSYSRFNEKENISLSILKQSEANTIRTASLIRKALKDLRMTTKSYGIGMHIVYDQSIFIKNAIHGLLNDALIGGILAFCVILLFLRNIRSSLIVCAAIPVSVMASFTLMYFFNISINMMSLGGLALGIGMLVDNAIVVVENISRHTRDMSYPKASVTGTDEVSGAIFSSTLTSLCVFLPLLWVVGIAGQIFRQLSLTVMFSLTASLVVAVSLIPRLTSTRRSSKRGPDDFLDAEQHRKKSILTDGYYLFIITSHIGNTVSKIKQSSLGRMFGSITDRIYAISSRMYHAYPRALQWFLNNRTKALGMVLCVFAISALLLIQKNREFLPKIDQHQFMVKIDLPIGSRIEVTNEVAKKIEEKIKKLPETKSITTTVGSNKRHVESIETLESHQAQIIVSLKKSKKELSISQRKRLGKPRSTYRVIRALRYSLSSQDLQRAKVEYVQQDSVFKSMIETSAPITLKVQGHDLDMLKKMTENISERLKKIPGIRNVRNNMPLPSPETKVIPNKDRAAMYNLSVSDIARTALIAIKGVVASKFKEEGNEIDILVRLQEKDRNNIEKLRNLTIHSPLDFNLPIKEVAILKMGKGPSEILRQDRQRTVLITAHIYQRSLKQVTRDINTMLNSFNKVSGFSVKLSGEAERIKESFASLLFVLIASIILVYMVMAAQFESLWQPFIIMFTIPLSLIGVTLSLWLTGNTLNAISMLGIIVLGGIVVNNGIVLIDYVNQLKHTGMKTYNALIQASQVRLRPICMTALTTILGLFPLSLGLGEGAELRAPMAVTVIGGLLISTLLTLFVIPTIYYMMDNVIHKKKGQT